MTQPAALDLTGFDLSIPDKVALGRAVDELPGVSMKSKLYLILMYTQITLRAIEAQPAGPERDAAARAIKTIISYAEAHFASSRNAR
ncbi:hypothetical protein SEA_MOLLYMUR_83 [Gordonia phage Mollymur]|uniref:Uncharacterized protein n=1 Tax=Gordonia phage Mollymur TaxID=2590895 RepID=A0A4Y6E9U6_9CAUD|nr:hypothetical protein PQB84_gp043 [Gordonia phage Mollymur]QDF15443.1 hypothetical protein SEA_MOLLYMUR_83 [Gordonia phage Mollymur]